MTLPCAFFGLVLCSCAAGVCASVVIECPASFVVNARHISATAVAEYQNATANTTSPESIINSISCSPLSGSTLPLNTTGHQVTCTANDTAGYHATCSFTVVTVVDVTAPVVTCTDIVANATSSGNSVIVTHDASATDNSGVVRGVGL